MAVRGVASHIIQESTARQSLSAHHAAEPLGFRSNLHDKVIAMWKFANPIKHRIPDTRWPAAEEAANSLLFQPVKIGSLELTSRTWVPAMVPWRATEDGFVTPDNLDSYRRFAEGQPASIVVEATGIRDIPSGPLFRISHDRFLPRLPH